MAGSVLVADPDVGTRELLREVLVHDGWRVDVAADRAGALALVECRDVVRGDDVAALARGSGPIDFELSNGAVSPAVAYPSEDRYDVIIVDIGLDLLEAIKAHDAAVEVVVLALPDRANDALRWVQRGAFDFVLRPFFVEDISLTVACAAARRQRLGLGSALTHVLPNHQLLR
jgi:DNA-binding NtrC family response regulator